MASNTNPSASPNPFSDPYDPYNSPREPIPLSDFSRQSVDVSSSQNYRRSASPDISPPESPAIGFGPTSRGLGRNGGQYAPVGDGSDPEGFRPQVAGNSLYSLSTLSQYKTQDAATQRLVDRRAGELAQWHIHWATPAIAIALFVAGVMAAVGHHLFYAHLDGQPAKDQLLKIRYGTALAFFVKSTLVGCVVLCYRQRIWRTLRQKAMTLRAIDGLFVATEDPTAFVNWEMISMGKLATFMAVCSWLLPLASVLSPSSLTSEVRETFNATQCDSVPTLNFDREAKHDFRREDIYPGSSLVFWNTTDTQGKKDDFFDYYDQPSKNAKRLAITAVYLKKPATDRQASLASCGERWNCTYSINFLAPGYKCDEVANPTDLSVKAPFNHSILAPQGDMVYYASTDLNDYMNPQIDTDEHGVPIPKPPYPELLGVFQSEPVLWMGHSVNTSKPYPPDSPYAKKWVNVHEPHIFKCVMHETNYTFELHYNDTVQTHYRKQRDFIRPIVDTNITMDSTNSSKYTAGPSSNFVRPLDREKYKYTAAYHGLGALFRNFLRGHIIISTWKITKSDISESRLMDPVTSYPIPDLQFKVQEVFEDIIITLLSEPFLVVRDKASVPCMKSRSVNVFVYHREGLWVGYAFAVFVTLCFLGVGAWSIFQNGVASDTLFSRIMVTTRNPTLDQLSVGACLGGDPFPKELTNTKMRFGVLKEENPREGPFGVVGHCCFGAEPEVGDIMKNGVYAGLREYRKDWEKRKGLGEEEVGNFEEKKPLLKEDSEDG
ncbi:hypothetical protein DM02DRAFT_244909 [Periconia macrospinosa]|uniref:Uncharacterized protein n=1 Tax=Periconia macrospinosa TaxID=97972 RepID=A0A2V1E252_9PLEO|nr:hypothetical protein DM02DRAFT_244909 [Periconia macrospinosa]